MPKLEIVPFSGDHLAGAAELLAERHARHRASEPLLPEAFEAPARALEELQAAWDTEDASGTAALRDGGLVGFLVGAPRDPSWGENVWVELAGQAAREPELVRDLYAAAAARWVEEGRTRHYALVPAHDTALVDAWFRLGFGQQQAYAVQETGPREVRIPDGFEIGPPRAEDVEALLPLDLALPQHQRASPVFSDLLLPTEEQSRQEWADTFARSDEQVFIGYDRGHPVACWALSPAERAKNHGRLGQPDRASYLAFAVTLPESRGSGIGVALTETALAWAAENGHPSMLTDWRVTNLLASRFWPRRGFRTTFLRLYRSIP